MSMDRDLGLGVVGAGYWGKNVVRNFDRVQRARLVAVADLVEKNRERAAAGHPQITCYEHHADLLERDDVHAVAICTGAASHHSIARDALLSLIHI